MFEQITDFILGNIGLVVFAIFIISGFLGRGNKAKPNPAHQQQSANKEEARDDRPLAERLAEHFGVEIPEEYKQAQAEKQTATQAASPKPNYASEGRRSTTTRNVQQQYPDLFGGPGMFDSSRDGVEERTKFGFDETEWGSTFEKSEEQWGNTFPEKKSSEPRIEWPS